MDITIDKMVYGGDGLARQQDGEGAGRVVLTPLVLPGERVRVEPVKEEARLVRARLLEILEPSAQRVAPPCPLFTRCGGCQYQHCSYEDQLRFKAGILAETLARIGKITPPEPQVVAGEPWNYRNRSQFKALRQGDDFHLGYFERGSQRLIDVENCPISSPGINAMLPRLWELGRRPDFPQGSAEIEVFDGGDQALVSVESTASFPETLVAAFRECLPGLASLAVGGRVYGRGHLTTRAAGFDFRISHGVFFQVNRFLIDRLGALVTANLEGQLALDLYAGAGYFTLPLSRRFERVVAVESNSAAVRDLTSSCSRVGITNVQTVLASTATFLSGAKGPRPDVILLDPPRLGIDKQAAAMLASLAPLKIVYVSCDPTTLARDLARLVGAGYHLTSLHLVDLFPQTFHMETVAVVEK